MSREIKFRAWNAPEKDMVYSDPMPDMGFWKYVTYDSTTPFMQYTGLKDKNGVEVYEGDILQHNLWKIPVQVYWEFGGFMAKSVTGELGKKSYTDGTLYDMQLSRCRVIGNIWENPGLLGKRGAE